MPETSRPRSRRRLLPALLAASLGVAGVLPGAALATAAEPDAAPETSAVLGTGSISGKLTAAIDPADVESFSANALALQSGNWVVAGGAAADAAGNYSIPGLAAGTYRMEFFQSASGPGYSSEIYDDTLFIEEGKDIVVAESGKVTGINAELTPAGPVPVDRISGADRYATSAAVAGEYAAFPAGEGVVYVASGADFPDALSAAPAAASLNAPLLLTMRESLPTVISDEITRLSPEKIVVVGGENAVTPAAYAALKKLAPSIERQSGGDRYETSRIVSDKVFGAGAEAVFLATGANFPDALSAAAVAGRLDAPVILVNPAESKINAATEALVKKLAPKDIFVVGGTAVISAAVQTDVKTRFPAVPNAGERVAGTDRYNTSVAINQRFFVGTPTVYLAVGTGYADALSGAALAGADDAPLYVVPGGCVPLGVLDQIRSADATQVLLLGGAQALSADVANLEFC